MAVDRSRLAAALAYKQAEEQRRRQLLESVPLPADAMAGETPRQTDFGTNLENLSIGLGRGLQSQLQGIKGIVTDPVGSARSVYEAGKAVVRDPAIVAQMLREMGQKATSGPLGAGEVIGEMLGPRKTGPVMAELDVYHGTPHRFPATEANPLGEFDASKIGTGEGAQAYGHGIYYAENPNVAKGYQSTLRETNAWEIDGQRVHGVRSRLDAKPINYAANALELFDGDKKAAIAWLKDSEIPWDWEAAQLLAKSKTAQKAPGSLYKADLPDEMIDRMLDWDKPLSEQPAVFKQLMKVTDLTGTAGFLAKSPETTTFGELYNALKNQNPQSDVSEYFRKGGIPGIKYLDAGSRGQGGSGTRNFVVFPGEEKKVRILERDGQKAPPQKIAQALEAAPDYRMTHRPMSDAGGASRLHNAYESFGEDIYGPKALQYFGAGDPREAKVVAALKRLRDNPDAEVTIYRGVPKDAAGEIGKGDWVTLDRSVAAEYGDKVLTKKVKAKDITTWPDSLLEFGYYPEN